MSSLGEARALELLSGALAGGGGAEIQAVLIGGDMTLTRFANSVVIQNMEVDDRAVVVTAVVAGRVGTAETNELTPEGLRSACTRALALARSARGPAEHPGFPDESEAGAPLASNNAFDEEARALTPEAKADTLARSFDRAERSKVLLAGRYNSSLREFAVVNSLGLARYHTSTQVDGKVFALDGPAGPGTVSGYAGSLSPRAAEVDMSAAAELAVRKCLDARRPRDLAPGTFDVLLEPEAVVELLEWLSFIGFTSQSLEDGTGFQFERLGERITGERVTILDDPACEDGVGIPVPFDWEGVAKRRVVFIDRGTACGVAYDRRAAARAGCASTGHAIGGGILPMASAAPAHLTFAGGDDSREAMLGRIERGLWVTRFHYVNGLLAPRRAVMTGLTRDGTFLVEDGRVVGAVNNLRFNDSVLEALTRVGGVGADLRAVPTWWSDLGAFVAPPLLIRGLTFTGRQSE